jgi:hypothetical protein
VLAKTLSAQINDLSHFMIVFIFINCMIASVSLLCQLTAALQL